MNLHGRYFLTLILAVLGGAAGCQVVGLVIPGVPLFDEVPADAMDQAIQLQFDAAGVAQARGFLDSTDDSDWFAFEAAPDTTYTLVTKLTRPSGSLVPIASDTYLVVFSKDGEFILENDDLVDLAARSAFTSRSEGFSVIKNGAPFEYEPNDAGSFDCRTLTGDQAEIIDATGQVFVRVFISPFQESAVPGSYEIQVSQVAGGVDDLIDFNLEGVFQTPSGIVQTINQAGEGETPTGILQLPVMNIGISDLPFAASPEEVLTERIDLSQEMLDQLDNGQGGWRQGVVDFSFDQDSATIFSGLELGNLYSFVVLPGHLQTNRLTTGRPLLDPVLIVSDGFGSASPGIANLQALAERGLNVSSSCTGQTTFFAFSQRNIVTGDGARPMLSYFHRDPTITTVNVAISGQDEIDLGDWQMIVLVQEGAEVADFGESQEAAFPLDVGGSVQSEIGFIGDKDWFVFQGVAGQSYRIDVRDVLGGDAVLGVLQIPFEGKDRFLVVGDDNVVDAGETIFFTPQADGPVFFEVSAFVDAFQFRYVVGVSAD
jgi:hypothetical protein